MLLVTVLKSSLAQGITCTGPICTLNNVQANVFLSNNLTGVTTLVMKNTKLSKIPLKIIASFPPLDKLDLSENTFTELSLPEIPNTVNYLTVLDVSRNSLATLTPSVFTHTPNLKELDLSRNQIQSVGSTNFSIMPDLTLIDLSHNKINVIEYSSRFTLDNLPNLRFLYLNHNGMQKFYLELRGSPNIELLDASYNNFNFDSWWFNFPKSTEVHLNVAFSGVTTIRSQKDIYGCVKRLKANNNLIQDLKIEPGMQLEELELSSNKISDIRSLTRLHNLRVLDLSENPLQNSLKGDIFVNLTALTHLSLKNTRTTIKKDLLEMNTNLKFLDLSNNQIGNFDLHTLKNLTNLEILRLDSNGSN